MVSSLSFTCKVTLTRTELENILIPHLKKPANLSTSYALHIIHFLILPWQGGTKQTNLDGHWHFPLSVSSTFHNRCTFWFCFLNITKRSAFVASSRLQLPLQRVSTTACPQNMYLSKGTWCAFLSQYCKNHKKFRQPSHPLFPPRAALPKAGHSLWMQPTKAKYALLVSFFAGERVLCISTSTAFPNNCPHARRRSRMPVASWMHPVSLRLFSQMQLSPYLHL